MAKNEALLSRKSRNSTATVGSEAEKIVKESRKRTSFGAKKPGEEVDATQQQLAGEMESALNDLYRPENFRGLVRAPADIAMAITGSKHFNLSDKEVETLATTGSATMRFFMVANPKWLALTLFSMSVITIYGSRTAMYYSEKSKNQKAKTEEKI